VPDLARSPDPPVPASPRATRFARARWGDARLLLGVLLVMTSVVVGSRVIAGADHTEQVWTVTSDLAAGTQLSAADLQPRAVRLGSVSGNYLRVASVDPAGSTLVRAVSAGDLLPAAALAQADDAEAAQRRQVTVPVAAFHHPGDLERGGLVDVYVTPGGETAGSSAAPELLVPAAVVISVDNGGSRFGGTTESIGVVLSVSNDDVASLVAGLHRGPVDLVRVSRP
jgi:hypothetical protein